MKNTENVDFENKFLFILTTKIFKGVFLAIYDNKQYQIYMCKKL